MIAPLMILQVCESKMVIEWKEREHGEEDEQALSNVRCMDVLRDCELLKFFMAPCIRAQMELLQYLISVWDIDRKDS